MEYHTAILTTFLLLLEFRKLKSTASECRYTRYISGSLSGSVIHDNVALAFPRLGVAKDACNLLGNTCKGINLRSFRVRRQYSLATGDRLTYSINDIAWRKSCPGSCEYSLTTDHVRRETYYRKMCSKKRSSKSATNKTWASWMQWGPCSQSCGTLGEQKRYRNCKTIECSTEQDVEARVCNYAKKCPETLSSVFGIFGQEGFQTHGSTPIYSTCIRTEQEQRRPCGNQANSVSREACISQMKCCYANDTIFDLYGGPRCFEAKHFIASSGLIGWSVWSPWTTCSVSCGSGSRSRNRICTGNLPTTTACQGPHTETEVCSFGVCPCSTNPCRNGGVCQVDPQITRGYRCDCPSNFIGRNCDFGEPRLVCGNDSITIAFDRRLIEDQGLIDDRKYIHFQGYESTACYARTSLDDSQYVLAIPPPIDRSCGSTVQVTGSSYSIRNKVLWKLTDQSASSTVVLLDLACIYNKEINKTIDLGFGIQPTVRTLMHKTSRIEFQVSMALYREADFAQTSLIRNSPTVAEGEILYVLINLKTISLTSPENEILVLNHCYAADASEATIPIYDFIFDGCSTNPTFTTVLENGLSSQGKWAFRVFEWISEEQTYDINIICKVFVCDAGHEMCLPSCSKDFEAMNNTTFAKTSRRQKRDVDNKILESKFSENIFIQKLLQEKKEFHSVENNIESRSKAVLSQNKYHMIVSRRIHTRRMIDLDKPLQAQFFETLEEKQHLFVMTASPSLLAQNSFLLFFGTFGGIVVCFCLNLALKKYYRRSVLL